MGPTAHPPADFVPPDWDAPVDLAAQLKLVPPGKQVKGFVLAGMARRFQERGLTLSGNMEKMVAFKSYPFTDQLNALLEGALLLNPKFPRRGLREAGQMAFPAALETVAGRVVFGALGKDPTSIFKVANKAYEMVGTGTARTVSVGKKHAHVELRDLYAFPESYHVGVVEGVLLACNHVPEVRIKQHSPTHVEIFCTW